MKKVINLTILSTIILALAFIPAVPTNAASKVNITYYSSNGYFKAKLNRSKRKITIKNKINNKFFGRNISKIFLKASFL